MDGWRVWRDSIWNDEPVGRPTAEEEAAFLDYVRTISAHGARTVLVALTLAAWVWWPLDLWFYADHPVIRSALAEMRLGSTVVHVVAWAALGRWVAAGRDPHLLFAAVAAADSVVVGGSIGSAGAVTFPFLYALPITTAVWLVPLRMRLWVVSGMAVLAVAAFTARAGVDVWDRLLLSEASFLSFCVILVIAVGDTIRAVVRAAFVLRRRLVAREAELSVLAGSLEAKVAEQTAMLRALVREAQATREEERAWIAREVHDELGQELLGLRLAVETARSLSPDDAAWVQVSGLLDRARTSLRRVLAAMRPRLLDEVGLEAALRQLVDEGVAGGALEVGLEVLRSPEPVPPDVALAVYRAAQEALTNVVRHAQAGSARLRLDGDGTCVMLEVEDDGVGLSNAPAGARGLGLLGIRERVEALGGSASWTSERGTRMRLVVPFGRQAR